MALLLFHDGGRLVLYGRELGLIADGKFDAASIAQEGKLAGADYLVFGTISRFSTDQNNTGLSLFGGKNKPLMKLRVELRMVEVRTGSIKLADSIEGRITSDKSAYTFLGFGVAKDEAGELGDLFDATAAAIVSKVITTVRPIIVLDVNRDEKIAMLNYGEGVVAMGDQLAMFQTGAEIKDPYTGQVLGKKEKFMATLRIVDVQPRFSKGQVIAMEENVEMVDLAPGMVCRVQQSAPERAPSAESPKPAAPSGARKPAFTF